MSSIRDLFHTEFPIIQAPMAGVQGSKLAIAVSDAGGLGSLPCALLSREAMRAELQIIRNSTTKPFNVNFFCHTPPTPDPEREAAWRRALRPYYDELAIDSNHVASGAGRGAFSAEAADTLSEFTPPVVSFHFGLPSRDLLDRVRSWGAKVLCSATTVEEARWLESRGVDAIIAQGLEAGGITVIHRHAATVPRSQTGEKGEKGAKTFGFLLSLFSCDLLGRDRSVTVAVGD